ncbi:probable G-protein coupled receptor CG31760 [Hetaerina americana]|uniref:probable G-protein coupled receptor CG31760 n=1 Tax=Hetaerina americana TaxID=62018 RepID=UPI003A7F185A
MFVAVTAVLDSAFAGRVNEFRRITSAPAYGIERDFEDEDSVTKGPWIKAARAAQRFHGLKSGRHNYGDFEDNSPEAKEYSLISIDDISTKKMGSLCKTETFRALPVYIPEVTSRLEDARQKVDLAATVLKKIGIYQNNDFLEELLSDLIEKDSRIIQVRAIAFNITDDMVINSLYLKAAYIEGHRALSFFSGHDLDSRIVYEPWYRPAVSSNGVPMPRKPNHHIHQSWWTLPYYWCETHSWIITYGVDIQPSDMNKYRGFLGLDIDLSNYDVNQCEAAIETENEKQLTTFLGTHKCDSDTSDCEFQEGMGWSRGSYICRCRPGYYSEIQGNLFNGTLMEDDWENKKKADKGQHEYIFRCYKCAEGCEVCHDSSPCLATYNWPFRITLLTISSACIASTVGIVAYVYQYRKVKVFKVASPIFLSITLLGCVIMYSEMAAIFPVLGFYSCIATKWTRHMGFCITYTALLMKTWRVSLTYRVKSAHKIKLTDKQLLQWMFPIVLVMIIYLGTWTLGSPPTAENIRDWHGLIFKQCSYNWWDHSLAIGEVFFLGWGIKVCLNVRNAESLFNEARLISYAIYNIALVNIAMVAFHLFIFPSADPDIKYLLGFVRTQLSTTVTIGLVFGPKVVRVMRGEGDQYDNRARARGVTVSFSLNGGQNSDETTDLYQENEELKEEIQKLAAQIEFMKIVHMEMNNRHIKPKPGGFFNGATATSPVGKGMCSTSFSIPPPPRQSGESSQQIPSTTMTTSAATTATSAMCCVTSPADTLSERV